MRSRSDRDESGLLFAVVALQLGLAGRSATEEALDAWLSDRGRPVDRLLVDRGVLSPEDARLVRAVVDRQLDRGPAPGPPPATDPPPADGLADALLIVLSGQDDQAIRSRALEAGIDHFLVKPAGAEEIDALIAPRDPGRP